MRIGRKALRRAWDRVRDDAALDRLDGLRDRELDDLVVVAHPYKLARAATPVAEPLGVLAEPE